jgi:hypothetical protein
MIAYEVIFRILSSVLMNTYGTPIGKEAGPTRDQREIYSLFYYSHSLIFRTVYFVRDQVDHTIRGEGMMLWEGFYFF